MENNRGHSEYMFFKLKLELIFFFIGLFLFIALATNRVLGFLCNSYISTDARATTNYLLFTIFPNDQLFCQLSLNSLFCLANS